VTDATDLLPGLEERFHDVRGVRLRAFHRAGVGRPLLLLHGFGGAAWNFSEVVPLLGSRPLIVPDLPGHGGSDAAPATHNLVPYADAVAGLLDEPVGVLGHSMGGVVALRLAERHPTLVDRVLLAAPAGISSSKRIGEATLLLAAIVQPAKMAGLRVERIARSPLLKRLIFGSFEVSNPDVLTERAVHGFLRGPTIHLDTLGAAKALARDDPRDALERVRCPTLVLFGARDRQVPLDDGFEYARRLGAPLRVIADCGHLLIGERPDVCARLALEFLR
jgi:3-oxoadipate enol-lactonase